ncbi:hypothetical protein LTR62_004257 [Meristemomyces frigidus]|uniref:Uncharacterized protein n=1 Tax=Meristemomyces frigidus TaxID=1508187 RepID=A0AAN7YK57_9PEZI|nr:hypothetical protein LTR62_004257 [Meristemomyces frigidus]
MGEQVTEHDSAEPNIPSSPPLSPAAEGLSIDKMETESRKRQYGDEESQVEHDETVIELPDDLRASQVKPSPSQAHDNGIPSSTAETTSMLPPPTKPKATPEPQQPPHAGQGNQSGRDVQHVATPSQAQPPPIDGSLTEPAAPDNDETTPIAAPSDPQEPIPEFDWTDLESRYHNKMADLKKNEDEIYKEFNDLCNFFNVWANATQYHEVDRSFKRLKTQMTYVRHEEEELEQKRGHYMKVVDAFKSALLLLEN